ncbi:restriction endonuclease subunit S [Allobaculum sp. JKK-2023]|uniref:restriction endonuclease subunit S n=1 Tax=Allobaculum sp. JKK-2023 TaxID=3108943 RepID=UPI002B05552D|nr:restriction endonuclease subunit S [Allobaculum sp. JKK-2023]
MKIMNLGQVATFINGYPFKPTQWAFEGIPIIRIQDLTGSQNNIHYFKGAIDKKYYVNQDDILISWSGTLGVHKWLGNQAVLNQHIFKVVFDKNIEIDRDYFERQIAFILKNAEDQAHGATMKHLTKKVFDSLTFKWVSITEQIYISNILNCLEKIIIRKNKQIDYLEEAVKSRKVGEYCYE